MSVHPDRAEQEISHLDFDVEKEKEKIHFAHPTEPGMRWCGERAPGGPYKRPGLSEGRQVSEVTCVGCLQLYIEKGAEWWWRVNKAWYGS